MSAQHTIDELQWRLDEARKEIVRLIEERDDLADRLAEQEYWNGEWRRAES